MSENSLLAVSELTVGYGGAPIVRAVSLSIDAGQLNCVVGPNGAGKSTALKAIAGALRPTAGSIVFDGTDVTKLSTNERVARGLGYVPQVANIFATLTVMENLHIGAYGKRSGMKDRIESVCTIFPDLKLALGRPAGTLSGGQRSMLALSRSLMADPKLLLLDEPTAGLAPKLEDQVWKHILAIQSRGIGVLVVEQNTRRALTNSDAAYVMVNGKVAAEGSGVDLLQRQDLVEMYLGG
ncbi:MAG: ABC transporter ATP-binding protein [Pseudonocardiales bacterium]|nr:MAG: ABC transporter ATP-binding protein [Pseudonocardiales bacterium]